MRPRPTAPKTAALAAPAAGPRAAALAALATALALAALLLVPSAARAGTADARLAAAAPAALAAADSPRGAAHLVRLHALNDEVEGLDALAAVYERVLARPGAHPLTRDTARLLLLDTERARGRLDRARALSRELGFVEDFYVLGSFDNEGKAGCDVDAGPEKGPVDLAAAYPAPQGREARWRRLPVRPADGYVDLAVALRPTKEAVGYALTWLDAPADGRVTLAVGTSGAFRLWVNGQRALTSDRYNAPRPDQARVSVRLKKGLNPVLLKVCQESGAYGFYLRQVPEGGGAARVRAVAPERAPAGGGKAPALQARELPTVAGALEALVQRAEAREAAAAARGGAKAAAAAGERGGVAVAPDAAELARLRADWAAALSFFRAFDEREHLDAVQSARAARALPGDAALQLQAAGSEREDFNARRALLEAALAADPKNEEALLALAQHELERGHPERALPQVEAVLKERPGSAPGYLLRARALQALGESVRAEAEVDVALKQVPRAPAVARVAANAARVYGRTAEARAQLERALKLRHDDRGSRRALAGLLADAGDVDGAARELSALLALDPFDNGARVRLGELEASNGRLDAARKRFAEARALAPDEPEVHEREGRALLAGGQRREAVARFEQALALRPQNAGLREMLRTLKGDDALGNQHRVDVRPLLKEADAWRDEDAVYLVDARYTRVLPSGQSSVRNQMAVKVLNTRGVEAFRSLPISYSPDRQEVRVLRVRITQADGSVVESYGESERNLNEPWTGMYYDARARVLSFPNLAPGDVLEVEWRVDDTGADNLLSDYWGEVDSIQAPYPKVRYQYLVEMPKGRPLYWNQERVKGLAHATETLEGGRTLYRWSAQDVSKISPEPSMPGWAEVASVLHVSTYQSWEQVGRYWWGLVRDQLRPDEELRRTVERVLQGVDRKDEAAVVRAVYNFVVQNTRYVALEFGIHGFKPYRVDRVLARRFGDCKDKASLIHAMLKLAGVDSRLVLLRMRNLGDIGSQPASLSAFNHAIAYVPSLDLYLDGTAEFHGARELPNADRLANVLVVEPDGKSRFLTTPEARAEDNLTRLEMELRLAPDGSAKAKGLTRVAGQDAPSYRRGYQSVVQRKNTFERSWAQSFPGLSVHEVKVTNTEALDADVEVAFDVSIPRYAEALPGALRFLPFGAGRSYQASYAGLTERRHDLMLPQPFTQAFRLRYALPAGASVKDLPAPVEETTPFGRVRLVHRLEGQVLVSEGEFALTATRIRAEEYPKFRAFLGRVDQAFNRRLTVANPAGTTAER